jgi:hypothetical protein
MRGFRRMGKLLALGLLGGGANVTLSLQVSEDTMFDSGNPTWNFGASTVLHNSATRLKSLYRFDLSSIPAGKECKSADLYLYHAAQGAAQAVTLTVYAVAQANGTWTGGNKIDAPGGAGDCCWNNKEQTPGSETAWAGAAGLATAGVDYENGALGTININRSDAVGAEYKIALTPTRIGGWFSASNTNYGLLVIANLNTLGIAAREHATVAYRPKLVVTYGNP